MPDCISTSTSVRITLSREYRQQNQFVMESEVQTLVLENSVDSDVIIYMDRSYSTFALFLGFHGTSRQNVIRADSGAMEVMAISKSLSWLETQTFPLFLTIPMTSDINCTALPMILRIYIFRELVYGCLKRKRQFIRYI
jgi:hypothetical protein